MEMIKVGPYGGQEQGAPWDEKGESRLTQIFITYDSSWIRSIQTSYIVGETSQLSKKHGGNGVIFRTIDLDCPSEFIKGISGYYSNYNETGYALKSLTFETNKRKIGPFGEEKGTLFSIQNGDKQCFGGFHGSSDSSYLYSIGVYLKPTVYLPLEEYCDMLLSEEDIY
ncbi:jacalin-related lectin 3-like [Telopea speciosissima]|uniref:jacalin-related lectin 3-like n=1 Tax=Telopea speciosissima TaxID=54955 RepID=UPI001CC68C0F|nr:jacalin-related lectin 3-like [Telopea speciosissima]